MSKACEVLNISVSTLYRRRIEKVNKPKKRKPGTGKFRALSQQEKDKILEVLHKPENIDKAPNQIYAELLDHGTYLCSVRTMYRILSENNEVKERRKFKNRRQYQKPELLATKPNMVWSWDISVP